MNAFFKESFELKDEDLTFRLDEQKKQDEEYRYDDSYDIWDDDHEYYDEEPIETIPDRINFANMGRKVLPMAVIYLMRSLHLSTVTL